MPLKLTFLPAATQELRSAYSYHERERRGLGKEFSQEVRRCLKAILEYPQAWPMVTRKIRQRMTDRFSYEVVYKVSRHEILIVAISHTSRKPRYWKERLK